MPKLPFAVQWPILLCAACAHEPMRADAATIVEPPEITAPFKLALIPSIDVSAIPDDEVCSRSPVTRDLCVTHFRTAFEVGLTSLAGHVFSQAPGDESIRIELRLKKFSHRPTSMNVGGFNTSRVDLAWSLRVIDSRGAIRLDLQESTQSPQPMTFGGKHDAVTARLVRATLEDVGRALFSHFEALQKPFGVNGP